MTQENRIIDKIMRIDWKYLLLGLVLILLLIYGVIENEVHMRQPSVNWSKGVQVEEGISQDYRMFSVIQRQDNNGVAYAYVGEEYIFFRITNWKGEIEESVTVELPESRIMVLKLDENAGNYDIYYSDRVRLYKRTIIGDSIGEEILVSDYAEQFDVTKGVVITGDDTKLQIIKDGSLLKEITDYNDVKKVLIKEQNGIHYFTYNTLSGGFFGVVDKDVVDISTIQNPKEQNDVGYFSDIYIDEDDLVLLTNKVIMASSNPNILRVYHLDKDSHKVNERFNWYHSKTTLDPKIVNVNRKVVSYILGVQQTLDLFDDLEKRFSWIQRGKYTNISLYTRENDRLLDNTRLTITRKYPMGYDFFNSPEGSILIWSDSVEEKGDLNIAGEGAEWIQYGRSEHKIRFMELAQTIVVGTVSASIWGTVFHLFRVVPYWYLFAGYLVGGLLFFNLGKGDQDKKWKWIFYGFVLLASILKIYLTAFDNSDLVMYKNVYPMIFGSNIYLLISAILSSVFSVLVYKSWEREYFYSSKLLKISFFIGVDYILYLLSIIIYMTTAMLVNSSLL